MSAVTSQSRSPRALVWNEDEGRLRAGWRVVGTIMLVTFAAVAATMVVVALGRAVDTGEATTFAAVLGTAGSLTLYAAVTATLVGAAWALDRRRVRDLGLSLDRAWWTDLAAGLAIGLALPAVVFAVEYALGFVRVTGFVRTGASPTLSVPAGTSPPLSFGLVAAYFVGVGVLEEVLFRGYLLTNAAEGLHRYGTAVALAVATLATSLLFGFGHGFNPSATPLAVAIIALYGGFLAAGYLLTGRIALPIGVHVAWNLAVSSVFGFPVSGLQTPVTLVAIEQSGPAVVTGGAFGPEGGLVALVGLVVGTAALLAWIRWREGGVRVRESVAVPDLRPRRETKREE
jgi:membrane protease YdiL (CAAX protease family)